MERFGTPISDPGGTLTHLFPSTADLAAVDPASLGLPATRQRCLASLVAALADGRLDLDTGADWDQARRHLTGLPGVGPWTAEMIAMRGFGDPDAFPATDLGVRNAAALLGLPTGPAALAGHAVRWRPWRAYVVQYLWAALDHPVNHWPPSSQP